MSELQSHHCMTQDQWTWALEQCQRHTGK